MSAWDEIDYPPHCRPTEFTYTTLSDEDFDSVVWRVQAEWRGPGDVWAITRLGYCLSRKSKWEHEPSPSNRSDAFKRNHRFTLAEAIERLPAALETVVINGLSVRDGRLVQVQ